MGEAEKGIWGSGLEDTPRPPTEGEYTTAMGKCQGPLYRQTMPSLWR